MHKILIFGNDYTINDFDFSLLNNNDSIITAGVNRIWKKYNTDYIYFLDSPIMQELLEVGNLNCEDSVFLYPSKYFFNNVVDKPVEFDKYFKNFKHNYCVRNVVDYKFPHQSITWLIYALENDVFLNQVCEFYIYGVSLKWSDDKHHFWVNDDSVKNKKNKQYHLPIFDLYYNGFKKFSKETKSKIYSISENSRINDIFEYKTINEMLNA